MKAPHSTRNCSESIGQSQDEFGFIYANTLVFAPELKITAQRVNL